MEIILLSAIGLASAVNSAMPGPCVALTIGRSANGGLRAGMIVTAGVVTANCILACLALLVTQGVVAMSELAYVAMKWIGATALVALALRMLFTRAKPTAQCLTRQRRQIGDAASGLVVGLSSPFNLIFLLALFPQLVPGHDLSPADLTMIVSAVLAGATVSQLGATVIGAASAGIVPSAARRIECLGALSMIGFGGMAMVTPIA